MDRNVDNEAQGEIRGEGESRAFSALPLTREHSVALPDAHGVMQRFNRDTARLVTGLMGAVIFAALVLAFQERHPKAPDLPDDGKQTRGDLSLNPRPTALSGVVGSSGESTDKITSGPATSIDHGSISEINHSDVQTNENSWSPAHRPNSGRIIRPKGSNVGHRSPVRPRFVDVKLRLIALWHQSLARSESPRSWTLFSNLSKGKRKKVGYTGETGR